MSDSIRALIVDDEPLARDRLRALLGDEAGVQIVEECSNGIEAVEAIRRSGGSAYAVPEAEIHAAVRALSARGLYAEPTSSVAAAALDHFLATGDIAPGETTVVVLTGAGLKSAEKMAAVFARPTN